MKKVILLICFCIAITTGAILKTFSEDDDIPAKDFQTKTEAEILAETLPPKYLTVPNFKQCLDTTKTGSATFWCIPNEKPEECPDSSWTELDEIGSIPKC